MVRYHHIRIALTIGYLFVAFTSWAQVAVSDAGQLPPHVLKIKNGYYGQILGIKDYGDGDTLFGLVPVYVIDSSTVKISGDTVLHTGNIALHALKSVKIATTGSYKGLKKFSADSLGLDLSILGSPLQITGTDRFAAWDPEGNGNAGISWQSMVSQMRDSIPGVSDGDKGDIDVTSSGNVWTIDTAAINLSGVKVTGTLPVNRGGTGLNSLGTAGQLLKVNSGATGLEYFTHDFASTTGLTTNRLVRYNGGLVNSIIQDDGNQAAIGGNPSNFHKFLIYQSNSSTVQFLGAGGLGITNIDQTNNNWATISFQDGGGSEAASATIHCRFTNHSLNYGELHFATNSASSSYVTNLQLSDGVTLIRKNNSSTAPDLGFIGDSNTGLYSPSADALAITTAGTERLRVDASGNVGIGITPLVKFHVAGQSRIEGVFSVKGSGSTPFSTSTASEIRLWNSVTSDQWSMLNADNSNLYLYSPLGSQALSLSKNRAWEIFTQDNSSSSYVLKGADGNVYMQLVTTDGAEDLRLGYPVSTSTVTLNAGVKVKYDGSRTSSFTVSKGDYILDVDASAGTVTATLPASPSVGQVYIIIKKDSSANAVIINGNGYNINGSASVSLTSQYDKRTIVFTGTDWRIIN